MFWAPSQSYGVRVKDPVRIPRVAGHETNPSDQLGLRPGRHGVIAGVEFRLPDGRLAWRS